MKKRSTDRPAPAEVSDLRPEYDFSGGVRGKHAARYAAGTNVILLDPDVADRGKRQGSPERPPPDRT